MGASMIYGVKQVGPNRFREIFGRYFEALNVGDDDSAIETQSLIAGRQPAERNRL